MTNYRVFENNGGGLELVVWGDDGRVVYRHSGYEHVSTSRHDGLAQDILSIHKGEDVTGWDGNEIDELGTDIGKDYTYSSYRVGGWEVIAKGDVGGDANAYPDRMGAAGKRAFSLDRK